MRSVKHTLLARKQRRRVARATLPWAELEAEAARQGCSPADVFFDRAGGFVPELPAPAVASSPRDTDSVPDGADAVTPGPKPPCDIWGRTADQRMAAYDSWGRRT